MIILKVKPGKLEKWREWCHILDTERRSEVLETLAEEGLVEEGCAEFTIGSDTYLVGYEEGEARPANRERQINRLHQEAKKECLEYVCEASSLYHFVHK